MAAQGMDVSSAVSIINEELVYAPGWTITAEDFSHRFENTIRVNVNYPACQTNRDQAREGYPMLLHADASFLMVCDCNELTTLLRKLLDEVILVILEREAREMLRVKPTFWAPFHPHKIGGMQAWGSQVTDMQFGLA